MEEIWKDVEGYDGCYQVSNYGKVKSIDRYVEYTDGRVRFYKGKILKTRKNKDGYLCVKLSKNGITYNTFLHRLIATAFIPNANSLPIINHKDENPSNNNISNLEWCTYKYNNEYNGLKERQLSTFKKKLDLGEYNSLCFKRRKIAQLDYAYRLIKIWESSMDIERSIGIKSGNISLCLHKKRNRMGKDENGNYYYWMYYDEYIKLSDEEKEELHNKYELKEVS